MALVGAPFAPFSSRHGGPRPSAASTFAQSSATSGSAVQDSHDDDEDEDDEGRGSSCTEGADAHLEEAKDKYNDLLLLGPGTSWHELGSKTTAASLSLNSSKVLASPRQGQSLIGISSSLWPSEPSGLRRAGSGNTRASGLQGASQGSVEVALPQLSPRSRVPRGITLLNCETGEQVFLSSESFPLSQSIALAKQYVAEKAEIPVNRLEILWGGQLLEGSRTFASYGVQAGDFLSVSGSRRRHRMADGGNRAFGPGAAAAAAVTTAALGGRHRSCGSAKNKPTRIFEWQLRRDYQHPPGSARHAPVTLFLLDASSGRKQPLPDSVGLGMKVRVVKEIVSYLIGLPAADMQLCWNGLVLHEGRSLAAYHIQSGQCLHAKRLPSQSDSSQRSVQLTILSMESHGKLDIPRFVVDASPVDLVFRVKEKIAATIGVPVSDQRLVFVGRSLSNFSTLEQVGITSDVTLQLGLPFEAMPDRNLMERNAVLSEYSTSTVIDKASFFITLREVWPGGHQYRCAVLPDAPISSLREKAAEQAGCLPSLLVLVHFGKKLQDGLNPNFYNLQVGDIIDVGKKLQPIKPPEKKPTPAKGAATSPRKARDKDTRPSRDFQTPGGASSSDNSSSPTCVSDEARATADHQHQRSPCIHWPPVPPPPRREPTAEEVQAGGWNRQALAASSLVVVAPPATTPRPRPNPRSRPNAGGERTFSQATWEVAMRLSKALVADAVTKAVADPAVVERTRLREMVQDYCIVLMFQVLERHEAACRFVSSLAPLRPNADAEAGVDANAPAAAFSSSSQQLSAESWDH